MILVTYGQEIKSYQHPDCLSINLIEGFIIKCKFDMGFRNLNNPFLRRANPKI